MNEEQAVQCPVAAAYLVVSPMEEELAGPIEHEKLVIALPPVTVQRQRYIYDIANPVRAMRHLLEDIAHVREILKYLESPECRDDMNNDHALIREHIKDHTIIFKGLLSTKERLETIVVRHR